LCDKRALVVGVLATVDVTKCCQQATNDRYLLITLSVQLGVYSAMTDYGATGARRAHWGGGGDPLASAQTCYIKL